MKYVKKILRILSFTIAGVLLVMLGFLIALQNGMLNNRIATIISDQGSKSLDARVEVGSVEGNPLQLFSLNDILIERNDSTVLSLESLRVNYRLGRLLREELFINGLRLENLKLNGTQRKDSSWSFMEVLPPTQQEPKAQTQQPSSWKISVNRFLLDSMSVSLSPLNNKQIPSQIRLGGQLNFMMLQDSMHIAVEHFGMQTLAPALMIEQLEGEVIKVRDQLSWENIFLAFPQTKLASNGTTNLDALNETRASLNLDPLNLEAFHPWMPGIKLYGTPSLNLNITGDREQQNLELTLQEENQSLSVSGWIRDLKTDPRYQLTLKVDGLDGEHWTRNPEFKSLIVGKLNASGRGFELQDNTLNISGQFGDILYGEYDLDDLVLQVDKNKGTLKGNVASNTWFGRVNSEFNLQQMFDKPVYSVHSALNNIDLSKLTKNKDLQSDLNLNLAVKGEGTQVDNLNTEVDLEVWDSYFLDKPVSNMNMSLLYNKGQYSLYGFHLNTPYAAVGAKGEGHLRGKNLLKFEFLPKNMSGLTEVLNLPDLDMKGAVTGEAAGKVDSLNLLVQYDLSSVEYDSARIERLTGDISAFSGDSLLTGQLDSLNLSARYNLSSIEYDSLRIKRLTGDASASSVDSLLTGQVDFTADSSFWGNRFIKRTALQSSYNKDELTNRVDIKVNDSLGLYTHTDLNMENDPSFRVHELILDIDSTQWTGGSDSTTIALGKDSIQIANFVLRSGEQELGVNGIYSFKGREDLHLWTESIDISTIYPLQGLGYKLQGMVNSDIRMNGTASKPELSGFLNISEPAVDTISLKKLTTNFEYSADTFSFEGTIDARISRMIHAGAEVPFHFSLTDSFALPGQDTPFRAYLKMDSLNLQILNPILEQSGMEATGMLESSVAIDNTIGDPRFNGNINLTEGSFQYAEEGIHYKNIELESRINNQRFTLDRAHLEAGGGNMNIEGFTDLIPPAPDKGRELQFQISGKNFRAVSSGRLEAVIEPSITIGGTLEDPQMKGNMKIIRSQINADAFMKQMSLTSDNPNPPILVEAMKDTAMETSIDTSLEKGTNKDSRLNIYNNLRGTFDIEIPGNTWVKGNDMNFEVDGKLKAIKQEEFIDLFGTLNITRGSFKYYGKKFNFEKGSITFTGGRDINPQIDFIMDYSFRDPERELQTLSIHISGRSDQPELSFSLNDKAIEERDAIAYIMFGKSFNRLSETESSSLSQNAGSVAQSLALKQVSTALSGALETGLGIDVVEIAGGKTWKSGSVKIGKYITDDLYLSYHQTFAFDKKEKVVKPEKITLEYQLLRSLFLQATNQMNSSGFDLIFKKSWE